MPANRDGYDIADALRQSPIFAGLAADVLDSIVAAVEPTLLTSRHTLFRQGDAGNDAYVVLSGRLRVEREGPDGPALVRELARGDLVGEFALLTGTARTATVTAIRDSELGRIGRVRFDQLLHEQPALAVGISRHLASLLGASPAPAMAPLRRPSVVVLRGALPLTDLDMAARGLAHALTAFGSVAIVDHERAASALGLPSTAAIDESHHGLALARWLHEVEAGHAFVVCIAAAAFPYWAEAVLRQADLVLEVLPADRLGETPAGSPPAVGCRQELVIVHPRGGAPTRGTAQWMSRRSYERRHHVRSSQDDDWARIARHLNGTSIGITFSGGGARGLSHLGLLRAVRELGIPIDEVGGTSIGSLVAAQWASGMTLEEMAERQRDGWLRIAPHRAYTLPTIGLVRARALETMLHDNFGSREYEDCWIDAFACSANLTESRAHFHRTGRIQHGCMASMAIPGIGPAFAHPDGSLHVDGAVVNNLPVEGMRVGLVIASDVSGHTMQPSGYPATPTGWQVLRDRVQLGRTAPYYPTLFDTILGSVLLGGARQAALASGLSDVLLKPPVGGIGLFEFARLAEAEAIGFEHAMAALGPWWSQRTPSSPGNT